MAIIISYFLSKCFQGGINKCLREVCRAMRTRRYLTVSDRYFAHILMANLATASLSLATSYPKPASSSPALEQSLHWLFSNCFRFYPEEAIDKCATELKSPLTKNKDTSPYYRYMLVEPLENAMRTYMCSYTYT